MFDFILAHENVAFSTALVLMLLIGMVEALGFGASAFDGSAELDATDAGNPLLGWIGFGRLPLLILLVVGLGCFALCGFALQQLAAAVSGSPLPPAAAAGAAAVAALPLTAWLSRPLARLLPADETSAVSLESLIGRRGRILLGAARVGFPARARVRDGFGCSHHVMVEPNFAEEQLAEGDEILLVGRQGDRFRAIAVTPHLTPEEGVAA